MQVLINVFFEKSNETIIDFPQLLRHIENESKIRKFQIKLQEIAKLAGVSPATVLRVFSRRSLQKPKTAVQSNIF